MNNEITMAIGDNGASINIELEETDDIDFNLEGQIVGTKDYNKLHNKPSVNGVTLINNKTSNELGLQPAGDYADTRITNLEIDALFN